MFGRDYKYLEQSLKDTNHPSIFSNQLTVFSYTDAGANRIFAVKQGTTISTNHIYVMAFGADWNYASSTQGRLISPSISVSNAVKFYRVFPNIVRFFGDTLIGKPTEPIRVYARTANITTDATTGWTLIDETNSLASFA